MTIIDAYLLQQLIPKELKLLQMNTNSKLNFAHEFQININQKFFSFKFETLLLLNFLREYFKIVLIRDFVTFNSA